MNEILEYFKPLFYPKTMAVIGASNNPVGAVKYVKGHKDVMKVYPVNSNPKLIELEGMPVYRSVRDIPEESIDLAIIGVPKEFVPEIIADFKKKDVKFAVIFTSGFEESGNNELSKRLRESIGSVKTRFIGPNCLGVYNPRGNLVYFPTFPRGPAVSGGISFISQSGGHTAKLNTFLMARGAFFSKTISIGNAIDLQPQDFLPYFKVDPETQVVGFYMESTSDGRGLMEALKEITPVKPVVIWKGGQSSVGMKATATHTGRLAGSYTLFKAMAEQSGAIVPDDFDTFADTLTALGFKIPLPKSKRIAIIGCGGGNAVEAADIFESLGFELPELHTSTREKINEFIPDVNSALRNPIDLGEYGYVPEYFAKSIDLIVSDGAVDAVVYIKEASRFPAFSVNFNMTPDVYEAKMVELLHGVHVNHKNFPLYLNDPPLAEDMQSYTWRVSFRDKLAKVGIPVFGRIDILARVILKLYHYQEHTKKRARVQG